MKNDQPNAAQKRWREAVRSLGSIISGGPAVVHHCSGRTAKHNKVEIGHFWIIPLTDAEHKALHNGETFTFGSRKEFEKSAFLNTVERVHLLNPNADLPPTDVLQAIANYHR